jgi:acyl carrier protein
MRPADTDLLAQVLECLADVLLDGVERGPDTPLLGGASGIDSIAIVELTAMCEEAVGITLAPELVVPDTFASPRTLAAAFAGSAAALQSEGAEG